MALTLIASTNRLRRRRIEREVRRLGHEAVWTTGTGQVRQIWQEGAAEVLILDSSLPGPGGVLPLLRWARRRRPRSRILVIEKVRTPRLQSACEKIRVPCLIEPVTIPILRTCLRLLLEAGDGSTRMAGRTAEPRTKPAGRARRESRNHEIDDLWFAVFRRMLR
jgi:DNA-binding NtrC family response regulator